MYCEILICTLWVISHMHYKAELDEEIEQK